MAPLPLCPPYHCFLLRNSSLCNVFHCTFLSPSSCNCTLLALPYFQPFLRIVPHCYIANDNEHYLIRRLAHTRDLGSWNAGSYVGHTEMPGSHRVLPVISCHIARDPNTVPHISAPLEASSEFTVHGKLLVREWHLPL